MLTNTVGIAGAMHCIVGASEKSSGRGTVAQKVY